MTRRNAGFTLVEVVVVVALIALVAVALGAAFTVIIRTTPTAEDRVDDANAVLGLTNWLPQDVASTDNDGFSLPPYTTPCSGPFGDELLQLSWSASGESFFVDYRFVDDGPGLGNHRPLRLRRSAAGDRDRTHAAARTDLREPARRDHARLERPRFAPRPRVRRERARRRLPPALDPPRRVHGERRLHPAANDRPGRLDPIDVQPPADRPRHLGHGPGRHQLHRRPARVRHRRRRTRLHRVHVHATAHLGAGHAHSVRVGTIRRRRGDRTAIRVRHPRSRPTSSRTPPERPRRGRSP